MMNINNKDVNLELVLGSTNYRIRTRLNNSSGAGVNADSRMDLAFAASDPLSELVWLPHKGLSLKCANSSAAEKKPFLLWDVGPSSQGLSPSENIGPKGSRDENAIDQGNLTVSQTMLDADDIFVDKDTLLKASESCHTLELGPSHGDCNGKESKILEKEAGTGDAIQDEENCVDNRREDLCCPQDVQIAGIAEICQENADLQPQEETDDEVTSASGAVNKNELNMPTSIPASPLKKLESAAENDLQHLTAKDACSSGGMKLPKENSASVEGFPTNSRIPLHQEKGKEKALSDGAIHGGSSDDEDGSHESVESCNNAGLILKGIKRQSCDKGVIFGSKRMKKQIHGNSRPNSSFMNWITNMVKGLSDFNKEGSSSVALTVACSNDAYGKDHRENFICNKPQDSASLDMGFQTIFQSLYCRDMNVPNTGIQKENDCMDESGEVVVDEKRSLEDLPGDRNCGSSCKQIIICNGEVNPIIVGRPGKPSILSADIDSSPYLCGSNLAEDKVSGILESNTAKDGVILCDSLGEQMNSAAEKTYPDIPVAMCEVSGKSNVLTSLWLTRLSTKNPWSEKCKEVTQETIECSTSCPKVNLDSQMNAVFPIDQKSSETRDESDNSQVFASPKESEKFITNNEASVDLNSKSKLCPILPSQKFRGSEAMASLFARRLDALRHIIPSEKRNSSTCLVMCFFCGGCHDIHECPNVKKCELEDLLLKMSSFDKVEESSCLCIRCSQSDHWAISCPLGPSSRHWISEEKASIVSQCTACPLHLSAGNEKSPGYYGGQEDHKLVASDHMDSSSRKPLLGSFTIYQTWNEMPSSERVSASIDVQRSTAINLANNVNDNQKSPLCNIVTAQNTVALTEIFHAIRNLHLSRADILRWMNSNVSLSHLNGFFLRLRLGKLGAGLEGSSYYVACIRGDTRGHNDCASKKSILVDVGGIKSSVASQYVSNHDFREDEMKAWWCRIVDSGCRIPSLDELNSKFNDRKSLGF